MAFLGRKTLQSERARMRRIDRGFERLFRVVLLAYFFFVLLSWIFDRPALQIAEVRVTGTETVNAEEIQYLAAEILKKKFLWQISRNNALLYPGRAINSAVHEIDPRIAVVSVSTKGRKVLHIEVTEYVAALLWCAPNEDDHLSASSTKSCFLADKEGYVFASAPDYSGYPFDVFRTNIAGSEEDGSAVGLYVLPREEFEKISEFRAVLSRSNIIVREVISTDVKDYKFVTGYPWNILWSSTRDAEKSVEDLNLVLSSLDGEESTTTLEHIDLRFGNKIFYK